MKIIPTYRELMKPRFGELIETPRGNFVVYCPVSTGHNSDTHAQLRRLRHAIYKVATEKKWLAASKSDHL